MKKYYVYALIDPRNDTFFYIGKGSGTRHKSHLKENGKNISNIEKHVRIQEIKQDGFEPQAEVLFPYLSEDDALHLERLLIYKLGRKCFKEGPLLNVVPGGRWKLGDPVFYDKEVEEFNLNKLDFVAKERFLSIEKTSDFSYWEDKLIKSKIFKYDTKGFLVSIDSLGCFFKNLSSDNFEIFKALEGENLPITAGPFVYSNEVIEPFYLSLELPLPHHHFFDSKFCEKFDLLLSRGSDFEIEYVEEDTVRMQAGKKDGAVFFKSFYKNGNQKSFRKQDLSTTEENIKDWSKSGKLLTDYNKQSGKPVDYRSYYPNGKLKIENFYSEYNIIKESKSYYESGNLKDWIQYFDGTRRCIRTGYFLNGKISFRYDNLNSPFNYLKYNERGILIEKFDGDFGYISYHEDGSQKSVNHHRQSTFIDYLKILKPFRTSLLSSEEYKSLEEEQRQADEDWAMFNGLKKRSK